jgi:hypothetical protein
MKRHTKYGAITGCEKQRTTTFLQEISLLKNHCINRKSKHHNDNHLSSFLCFKSQEIKPGKQALGSSPFSLFILSLHYYSFEVYKNLKVI